MPDAGSDLPHSTDFTALDRLRALIRIPTISRLDTDTTDWAPFDHFVETLARLYPLVHEHAEREIVAGHSLLFRWPGSERGAPTVLMAHYDVVAATDDGWTHPPFSAHLDDEGILWGRGALDDKGALAAVLEAVESLLADGHRPRHDVFLSFGHDEETHGSGALAISALFAERGIRPRLILDEGGAVVRDIFPAVLHEIAVVGVAEKGMLTLQLTVDQVGGHASTPPRLTATVRLARAILRLGRFRFPRRLHPVTLDMIRTVGAHARGPLRSLFVSAGATAPALVRLLARLGPETRAMVSTTQAVTMLEAGQAANALAERATATVNLRIALDASVDETVRQVERAVRDPDVSLTILGRYEPSAVSRYSGAEWTLLADSITASFPEVVVTPYVMLGATDSRHFTRLSPAVYRFSPFRMTTEQRASLHARDERIDSATFLEGIAFYRRLIVSVSESP